MLLKQVLAVVAVNLLSIYTFQTKHKGNNAGLNSSVCSIIL